MYKMLSAMALVAGLAAQPAAAVTYDAFSSFTGTNTGGLFTYGVLDATGVTPTFTPFNDAPGCASLITNTICTSNGFLPAAFKSTSGAHQSGSVIVPGDALIIHPGPNAGEDSAILFTTPQSGNYALKITAAIADTSPSGVNFVVFEPGVIALPLATLNASNPTFSNTTVGFLAAGTQFGIAVDYDGSYNNDSTAVNFSLTAVPEPATWALMLTGFGLAGVTLRRRRAAVAA